MALEQLDLFGNIVSETTTKKDKPTVEQAIPVTTSSDNAMFIAEPESKAETVADMQPIQQPTVQRAIAVKPDASLIFLEDQQPTDVPVYKDDKIVVKLKSKVSDKSTETEQNQHTQLLNKRGRKSYKELEATADLLNIPDDETLQKKLYYGIGEVAEWFHVNASQIRFWENEFDILKPRKTKKGDRLFRIEDIKNLQLIYHLLRTRKFSIEGAKDYLKTHKEQADVNFEITQSLTKFRSFLLELKANLGN